MNSEAQPRSRPGSPQPGPFSAASPEDPRPGEAPSDPVVDPAADSTGAADSADPAATGNPATNAARAIPIYLRELSAYAQYWLAAKLDSIKLGVRNAAVYAAVGVIAVLAAGAAVVTAIVLLLIGLARLIDVWTHTIWAGDVIVGVLFLVCLLLGIYVGINKFMGISRKKTEKKYEAKRLQQRVEHGRDVSERAQKP